MQEKFNTLLALLLSFYIRNISFDPLHVSYKNSAIIEDLTINSRFCSAVSLLPFGKVDLAAIKHEGALWEIPLLGG